MRGTVTQDFPNAKKGITCQPRYQGLPGMKGSNCQSHMVSKIKPQIAKEYVSTLAAGRPDLSILEEEFEFRDKFYEEQFSDLKTADIKFRETES